jgi:hypothetical protein
MADKGSQITGALQENLLTLLCFDDNHCKLIRYAISSKDVFESSLFREVAGHAISFIDTFGTAIKDHLPDELEAVLTGDDKRRANLFKELILNMRATAASLNSEYVISQLNAFIRQQHLKTAVVRAVEAIEDGRIDQAEVELQAGLSKQIIAFDKGTALGDPNESLKFLDDTEPGILTGISPLDDADLGPRRKELMLVMAPPSRGKTWALIHLGKWAMLQRLSVLHVTLEMSEDRVAQRYIQSFFAVSKRQARVRVPSFLRDRDGRLEEVVYEDIERITLADPNIRAKLATKLTREFRRRPPLVIKQFPTGALTMTMLRAYLDGMERHHHFVPDVLIIDYPDLMSLDTANMRIDTGKLYKDLRGIAVERNMAVVGATQSNREGSRARVVDESMVAEDFSKIMIADTIVSYSQTEAEKKLGLARLFAVKSRNDESKFTVLIGQAYAIGQFALDAVAMQDEYWQQLEGMGRAHDDEDDKPLRGERADQKTSRRRLSS